MVHLTKYGNQFRKSVQLLKLLYYFKISSVNIKLAINDGKLVNF